MISVAIIDDHAVVRMGLKYVIGMDGELEFVGELSSGQGAVEFVKRVKPDVLLLDIYMPGRDGLQVLEDIRLGAPGQKVIMLTTSAADNDVYRAMTLGAYGYLLKDRDADDIYRAIKTVAAGRKYVPEAISALMAERRLTPDLTMREQCVLNMMVEGSPNDRIADEMGMSVNGVKQHVKHIFAKLGVSDRVSAVTEAIKRGFVKVCVLTSLALGACCLAPEARGESVTSFGALNALENVEESAGVLCELRGIVTHVSVLHPRMFLLASEGRPWTAGVVAFLEADCKMPQVGDEIWAEGTTMATPWRLGMKVKSFVVAAKRPIDFEYNARHVEIRKGLLDFRRVAYHGKVSYVNHEKDSEGREYTVLSIKSSRLSVPVHVPGMLRDGKYLGREVTAHGFVFPLRGDGGKALGYCIETTGEDALALANPEWERMAMFVATPLMGAALVVLFVAWVRSRRERIRMEAVAEERRRMAKDLHDTIEQHLACVRLLIAGVMNLSGLDPKVRETLKQGCAVLANAKAEVREAVLNLRGDAALALPPATALREIAANVSCGGVVKVRTRLAGLPAHLPQGKMQDLLFIVREAITNALKHGKAKTVVLLADKLDDGGFSLRVLNDGEPFDAAIALGPETGHFGLSGMRERAARSGFALDFGRAGRWTFARLILCSFNPNSSVD